MAFVSLVRMLRFTHRTECCELQYFFLHIIVKSFVELVCYLFMVPGVKAFLSRRVLQDPLEQIVWLSETALGVHDNPSTANFSKNSQVLQVVIIKEIVKGTHRCPRSED